MAIDYCSLMRKIGLGILLKVFGTGHVAIKNNNYINR